MESNLELELDKNLFEAIQCENFEECLFLLNAGANPCKNFTEYGGLSSFHLAIGLLNDLKFTKLFLAFKANPNIRTLTERWTPLHICANNNKPNSLDLLLQKNGDPFLLDNNGKSVIDIAKEKSNHQCIEILSKYFNAQNVPSNSVISQPVVLATRSSNQINDDSYIKELQKNFDECLSLDTLKSNYRSLPLSTSMMKKCDQSTQTKIKHENFFQETHKLILVDGKFVVKSNHLIKVSSPHKENKQINPSSKIQSKSSTNSNDKDTQTTGKLLRLKKIKLK